MSFLKPLIFYFYDFPSYILTYEMAFSFAFLLFQQFYSTFALG